MPITFAARGPIAIGSVAASWQTLKIGGGGFSTGIVSHAASGKLAIRIDVYGAYGLNAGGTTWKQLATATSMPSDYQSIVPYAGGGVYDVAFDPTDASGNTIYMYYCPYLGGGPALSTLLKSTDGGNSFARTGFPLNSQNANTSGSDREISGSIGVDPANGNVVYVGVQSALYQSLNGGTSFSTVGTVPAANVSHGICGIAFDTTSGTTTLSGQTVTTRMIVASSGNGVYATADGGATFALITSSPTNVGRAVLGPEGNYYACPQSAGSLTRITPGNTVSTITASDGLWAIAVDPYVTGHAFGSDVGGYLETFNTSVATGTPTPSTNSTVAYTANDCGWLSLVGSIAQTASNMIWNMIWDPLLTTSASSMTIGNATFNPTIGTNQNVAVNDVLRFTNTGTPTNYMLGKVSAYNPASGAITIVVGSVTSGGYLGAATGGSGTLSAWTVTKERIWLATGMGVFYIDTPPSGSTTYHMVSVSAGIESLVSYGSIFAPGGPVGLYVQDTAQFFPIASDPRLRTGAPGKGPISTTGTTIEGARCDVAANDSTYWVASDSLIFVGSGPISSGFSTNSGVVGDTTNGNTTSFQSWPTIAPVHGYIKCASSTNTVIAAFNGAVRYTTDGGNTWGTPAGSPATVPGNWNFVTAECLAKDWVNIGTFYVTDGAHVFRSTDGGANWTQRSAVTSTSFLLQLKSVPGQGGHLFFTAGSRQDGQNTSSFAALKAYHPVNSSFLLFSNDGGGTFNTIPNTKEVISVTTSAADGGNYPCVAFIGWLSGVYGIWESKNFDPSNVAAATWTNIAPPLWLDVPTSIDGSPNTAHLYIVSFYGSSFEVYGGSKWP